jgi:hypothetical protein
MASLYDSDGRKIRDVRNLGWLLRHWKTAQRVRILPPKGAGLHEARMVVLMDAERTPGRVAEYRTDWASSRLLWDWLRRPVLIGLPLEWGHLPARPIGEGEYPGEPTDPGQPLPLEPKGHPARTRFLRNIAAKRDA